MLTGRVWDACEAMESLPQNNFQVTCKIMQREEGLVFDAVQEIEEVLYLSHKTYIPPVETHNFTQLQTDISTSGISFLGHFEESLKNLFYCKIQYHLHSHKKWPHHHQAVVFKFFLKTIKTSLIVSKGSFNHPLAIKSRLSV
jgi:hypothetical protein